MESDNGTATVQGRSFAFDGVCGESSGQGEVFDAVGREVCDSFVEGVNGCIFAYGQTGAGKTHTMVGERGSEGINEGDGGAGLMPRALRQAFDRMADAKEAAKSQGEEMSFSARCTYVEVYNEQVHDLLDPEAQHAIAVREDRRGVAVEGATERTVNGPEETLDVLHQGGRNRRVATTLANHESSRAHSVLTLTLDASIRAAEGPGAVRERRSRLHLVDLAGSERQKSADTVAERLREAAAINKSLSALGNVIKSLVEGGGKAHVPYRDSKLTFLLKDALGGSSRTALVACVSPSAMCTEETLSTLQFASRARQLRTHAAPAEDDVSGTVHELQAEVKRLRRRLEEVTIGPSDNDSKGGEGVGKKDWPALAEMSRQLVDERRRAEEEGSRLRSRVEQLEDLTSRQKRQLQSTKAVLRLREEALKRAKGSEHACSTESELAEEAKHLRGQLDFHPDVVKLQLERDDLANRLSEAGDGLSEELTSTRRSLASQSEALAEAVEREQESRSLAERERQSREAAQEGKDRAEQAFQEQAQVLNDAFGEITRLQGERDEEEEARLDCERDLATERSLRAEESARRVELEGEVSRMLKEKESLESERSYLQGWVEALVGQRSMLREHLEGALSEASRLAAARQALQRKQAGSGSATSPTSPSERAPLESLHANGPDS